MPDALKPADYFRLAREVQAARTNPPVNLAVLASFTADFLAPYIIVEADRLGLQVQPWVAPFNQLEQQALDPASLLFSEKRDVVWLALRLEDSDPTLLEDLPVIGPAASAQRVHALGERLVAMAKSIRAQCDAAILVSNLACPSTFDSFDANDPEGLVHLVAAENRELARAFAHLPDIHIFDWAGLRNDAGAGFFDPKLWYMARVPVASAAQIKVARLLARSIRALLLPAAKCIVVDLDNTLWGGVLGDDGPEKIQLGDAPPGNVFKDVQRVLLRLQRRGFLLAVASKNDEALVRHTLDHHPEMLLRSKDFSAIVCNWESKPGNLTRIAATLNLGLDSLVFLDDNPVERAQVRAELPMVHVIELPSDPISYLEVLRDVAVLDRPRLSAEDRSRASMYAQDVVRRNAQQAADTVEDYLRELEMTATVGPCDPINLERVHQLVQKTNQFNLATRRHTADQLARLAAVTGSAVQWLRLRDRHGDLGLVCVGVIRQTADPEVWEIDTFVMSCRVMGRQVEAAFLAHLVQVAVAAGARRVRGVYRPTARNHMVADFYLQHGFTEVRRTSDEVTFEFAVAGSRLKWPSVIRLAGQESACSQEA